MTKVMTSTVWKEPLEVSCAKGKVVIAQTTEGAEISCRSRQQLAVVYGLWGADLTN